MMQAHVFISGFVQGVGFRQFIRTNARKLGVTGWVRNIPGDKVEAVFQGDREMIEQLITLCKRGPFLAEVKDVSVVWEEAGERFTAFAIH